MTVALVIDDEPAICACFETLLNDLNCEACVAASAEEGLQLVQDRTFDVIVLDVRLPGMDGLAALAQLQQHSQAPVIVMTAHGNLSTAVTAVREGAFDYLPKPFELDHVTNVLKRAISESAALSSSSTATLAEGENENQLLGNSLAMQHLFRQIAMAAQHDAPVLVLGDSGTGKELVAQAIHRHGARSGSSLVPVNLSALSEGLLERELFGHSAGAFTGADRAQAGFISQANNGTLFLDEIGETPQPFQVKLLRTLESGEFYPVGSSVPHASDFRLIAATNVSIEKLRSAEHFRQDFFFRLATIQIQVPPLREHKEDIPELAQHFLNQHSINRVRHFDSEALRFLQLQSYPGNIRELKNVVIRAAAATSERLISLSTVKLAMQVAETNDHMTAEAGSHVDFKIAARQWAEQAIAAGQLNSLQTASEIVEAELIAAALQHTDGNRSAAAQLLGIHRETLRDKLRKRDAGIAESLSSHGIDGET